MAARRPLSPLSQLVSRRNILRGAGLASAVAVMGACGVKPDPSARSSSPAAPSDSTNGSKSVHWSNWPNYIDIAENSTDEHPSLTKFTKETGIAVTYVEDINDNNQFLAKIQPQLAAGQSIAADLVVVTDWMATKLLHLGYAAKLNHANIPNLAHANPSLLGLAADPKHDYTAAWTYGLTGIAYNPKLTGTDELTMDRLLTDTALRGKVTLLSEMQDSIGMTLLDLGFDTAEFTDEQFNKALAKIKSAVDAKQIRQFTGNDYGQGLANGDIAAAVAWTGDVVQLTADNPDLKYVLPAPGYLMWSDNFMVPIRARNQTNAEALINFYYQPEVAATLTEYINFISPVAGVQEILAKDNPGLAENELIFPREETLKRGHIFMELTPELEHKYEAAFAEIAGV